MSVDLFSTEGLPETPADYSAYSVVILLSSLAVTSVGVAAHLFILLACFRVQEDHKSLLLLQQLTSAIAILGLLTGGLTSVRHKISADHAVFLCYGLLKYANSPRLCAVWDLFPGMHVPLSSLLVSAMIAFRCLGIMGRYVSKRIIWTFVILSILITSPLAIFTAINYVDVLEDSPFLTEGLQQEAKQFPIFALEMTIALSSLFELCNLLTLISTGFGVATAFYSHFVDQSISKETNDNICLHKGYFRMLYFETTTMTVYAIATHLSHSHLVPLPPSLTFYISAFNFIIFAVPTVLQGILTIIFVPYLRNRLIPTRRPKISPSLTESDLESNTGSL